MKRSGFKQKSIDFDKLREKAIAKANSTPSRKPKTTARSTDSTKSDTVSLRQEELLKQARKWLREVNVPEGSMLKGQSLTSKMANVAWGMFSGYIRQRDFKRFRGCCYTCEKIAERWQDYQCGHYISRGNKATLYNEQNNHMQCPRCNNPSMGAGMPRTYSFNLNRDYGEGTSDKLYALSRTFQKDDFWWHYEIAEKYYKLLTLVDSI